MEENRRGHIEEIRRFELAAIFFYLIEVLLNDTAGGLSSSFSALTGTKAQSHILPVETKPEHAAQGCP
jgi:hypothetical protein